jgi:hypothetical protein
LELDLYGNLLRLGFLRIILIGIQGGAVLTNVSGLLFILIGGVRVVLIFVGLLASLCIGSGGIGMCRRIRFNTLKGKELFKDFARAECENTCRNQQNT